MIIYYIRNYSPSSASQSGGNMREKLGSFSWNTKIADFCNQVFVQQDVAGLHISVNHWWILEHLSQKEEEEEDQCPTPKFGKKTIKEKTHQLLLLLVQIVYFFSNGFVDRVSPLNPTNWSTYLYKLQHKYEVGGNSITDLITFEIGFSSNGKYRKGVEVIQPPCNLHWNFQPLIPIQVFGTLSCCKTHMPKYKNKPGSAQEFASESQQHFSTTQIRKVTINNLDFDTANVWKFYHQNPVDSADILLTEKMPVQVPIFHVLIHQYLYPPRWKEIQWVPWIQGFQWVPQNSKP